MKLILLLLMLFVFGLFSCQNQAGYIYNQGYVYGTVYKIVYESPDGRDLHDEIKEKFSRYNAIFSTFDTASVISRVNNNLPVEPDSLFLVCFNRAMEISEITCGAFDITAGSMVNAWGFGPEERMSMTPEIIDSLMQITGYKKIRFRNGDFEKESPKMKLDMSAIAKGYTCDLIAGFLDQAGCENYMVEIGGEVVAKGKNEKGRIWTIGISKPDDLAFLISGNLQAKVHLPDNALATSGNYLNYYEVDGKRYAHTIDPKTGYPVQHSLLSATVVADNCMDADAFATAFMVLGLERSIEIVSNLPELEVYFLYADDQGITQVYMSESFRDFLVE